MKNLTQALLVSSFAFLMSGNAMADGDDPAKMRAIAQAAGLISVEEASEKALAANLAPLLRSN